MVNMQNNYNQLMDIAKSAYGSGTFEGAKGGNGYVGQYVDSEGRTHVVKVLTHRNERSAYAGDVDHRDDTAGLAAATQQLKANLIAIADGENPQLGETIRKMLEDAQAKAAAENMTAGAGGAKVGLLSRKIVAKAISTIAKEAHVTGENGRAFSWNDVARNRAATEEDTTAATVNRMLQQNRRDDGVQNQNVQNNQVQPEINELPQEDEDNIGELPPKEEEENKIGEPPLQEENQLDEQQPKKEEENNIGELPPKKEENKINEPQQQQEIKVRMTPLQLAKNSCANYIKLLGELRDSQLNAIKNAGFSSPSDEWILKGLRDHYDKAIENANAILNRGDVNEIKTLFGEEFENREEPLADDALKSKLFADSKNVLSKTLCSLALLSEYEFGEDEDNFEEYSNKLAGMLEDAFKLSDLDDFTAKLDRVKALVRPEGKDAACVRTLFQKVLDDFVDEKSVNGRPNPCQGDDGDYVDEHASFSKFASSKELKTMLLAHLQGGKALERNAIGNACFDYAVQLVTDHRLNAVQDYTRELRSKLTDLIKRDPRGHRPPVTVKRVAEYVNAMCGNLLETRPTAFGGMDEVQNKRYSDYNLELVDSHDKLKNMIQELFLDGLKERYDRLIANAANDVERKCLARQRDEEVDVINGFIEKIERPGAVVVSTKSWHKRRRDV